MVRAQFFAAGFAAKLFEHRTKSLPGLTGVSLIPEVLVEDGDGAGDVGVEGDLVVGVESGPDLLGGGHAHENRLAGKGGQGIAVALVGADEVAAALVDALEAEEVALATVAALLELMLEDGHLKGAVGVDAG